MKAQHTPGPWSLPHFAMPQSHFDSLPKLLGDLTRGGKKRCDCGYVFGNDGRNGAVATVHFSDGRTIEQGGGDDPPREEAVANARLIAAAPDLLAACRQVNEGLLRMTSEAFSRGADWPLRQTLTAAIARAEGRE